MIEKVTIRNPVSGIAAHLPFLSLLITCILAQPSLAQIPEFDADSYPVPADMSGVHFYLVTVDVGNKVWDNFGHTALRMYDESSDTDLIFNWGQFDVSGGVVPFAFNFFKGIMNYQLYTAAPSLEFDFYRAQQRSVWQERINLTNPQKEILYKRLMWNIEPENRVYAYQYYNDNCTTRVRDYLDEALGGKLSAAFQSVTEETYRDQVQSHYASVSLIAFSLDVLMNGNIDRLISEWEEMYLPLRLRQNLSTVMSDVAENGEQLPLLSDYQVITNFSPPNVQSDAFQIASVGLIAPVVFLLLMLKRIPMSYFATHSRIGFKLEGLNFRLLGILGLVTAVFSGIYGTLMLGAWFISDHVDTHHNINLLLFWPTDLLGIIVGLRWLLFCKPWPTDHNTAPFINYYLLAHLLAMVVYVGIALAGMAPQAIDRLALYVVPGFFLFTVLIWVVGFQPAKPKNMFF